ncbi:MAG: hypothetical protein JNL97_16965, partial [Verrucomicrobiales bacterium]|nr:hypothetical protein [Verrucomicrobiales bacterium]
MYRTDGQHLMKPPSILPNLVLSLLLLLVPGQAARATDIVTVLKMTSHRQSEDGPVELVQDVPTEVQGLVSPRFSLFAWSGLDMSGVLSFLWLERGDGRRLDLATGGVMQVFDGFDSASALESAYPAGSYLLRAVKPDDSESRMALRLDGGAFPPAPRLTNIRALSSQEGASEFVLAWDPFVGGTTNDIIVLSDGVAMSSHLSGTLTPPPGHPRVLDGTATSVVLRNHILTSTNQYRLVFIKVTDRQTNAAVDWVGITGMASETVVGFSAVREVVPPPRDTNAPVLVDHDPPDGQTNVWVGTSVRFDFDRPMADVVSIGWSTNIDGARMSCQWSGGDAPQTFLYCNYAEPLPSDAVVTWVLNPTGATGPAMAGTNGVALPANRYS